MAHDPQSQRLELIKAAIEYLDKHDSLKNTRNNYQLLSTESKSNTGIYEFFVSINHSALIEVSVPLANLVVIDPRYATGIFQEVIANYAQLFEFIEPDISPSQVSVRLVVDNLCGADNTDDIYKRVSKLYNDRRTQTDTVTAPTSGLIKFRGVIIGVSAVSSFTKSTQYFCPVTKCPGHTCREYTRVHVPGAMETHTIRSDFRCLYCGSFLNEDPRKRTLGEKVIVEAINPKALRETASSGQCGYREQALLLHCRDNLIDKVRIGKLCMFIGAISKNYNGEKESIYIEVNNIIPLTTENLPSTNMVPLNNSSPLDVAVKLAVLFGDGICSPGSFLELKISIILSLVLMNSKHQLHLSAIGQETSFISKLLMIGMSLTDRSVLHRTTKDLIGKATPDVYGNSKYFINGGSLALSDSGVCNIGNINCLKPAIKDELHRVLVSGNIAIDVGTKLTGTLARQACFPLNCHVWAYGDPSSQKPKTTDDLYMQANIGQFSPSFIDSFSLILFTDSRDSSGIDNELITALLYSAMNIDEMNPDAMHRDAMNREAMHLNVINPYAMNPDVMNLDTMNRDTMKRDTMNLDVMNLDTMNLNTMNRDAMNLDTMNHDTMNHDTMNRDTMNLDTMNHDTMNCDTMNRNMMNPYAINPYTMNLDAMNPYTMNLDAMNPYTMNPDEMNPGSSISTANNFFQHLTAAIKEARAFPVDTITKEAEQILIIYYRSRKRYNSISDGSCTIPPSALKTLRALTIAFAKLGRSSATGADVDDATCAAFLYESTLSTRYGHSVFDIECICHQNLAQIGEYINSLPASVYEFKKQLQHLMVSSNFVEE